MNNYSKILSFSSLVVILWFLAGCQASENGSSDQLTGGSQQLSKKQLPNEDKDKFVILALGDSLTEGLGVAKKDNYPAILERELHARGMTQTKVINSGLSGETSSGLKNRIDWVLQLKPDLTILNIGANDAMRGLPLELTQSNISHIINKIKANGSGVLLAGMQIYDNLGQEYVAGFKDMYGHLATQHTVPMIPFFLEHVAGEPSLNQTDMIHPNKAGYEMIVERNLLQPVLALIKQ